MSNTALIVVDMLNDFVDPNGAMPIQGAVDIVEPINMLAKHGFRPDKKYKTILLMQDSHNTGHCSFKENGGDFPTHCVKDTWGAEIYPELRLRDYYNIYKGIHDDAESFGGFKDDKGRETSAPVVLGTNDIDEVHIVGVATEFCVKETVLQAAEYGAILGFNVCFIPECIRGLSEDSTSEAYNEMGNVAETLMYNSRRNLPILTPWK